MNKAGELVDVAMVVAPLRVDGATWATCGFRDIGERGNWKPSCGTMRCSTCIRLANRTLFLDRLTMALKRRTRRREQNCGVL